MIKMGFRSTGTGHYLILAKKVRVDLHDPPGPEAKHTAGALNLGEVGGGQGNAHLATDGPQEALAGISWVNWRGKPRCPQLTEAPL